MTQDAPEGFRARPEAVRDRTLLALFVSICLLNSCAPLGGDLNKYHAVTIDFSYGGNFYHKTWIQECVIRKYYDAQGASAQYAIFSKRMGFAERLPDGSAVYFKMRSDPCLHNELNYLLFGPPDVSDRVGYSGARNDTDKRALEEAGARQPLAFTLPTVYWLDNARDPAKVEVCAYSECALAPEARVRFLSISGSTTTATHATESEKAVPALASLTRGPTRFVGYACWALPVDQLPIAQGDSPDTILSWGESSPNHRVVSGPVRAQAITRKLSELRIPLFNAWTWSWGEEGISDLELAAPQNTPDLDQPRRLWSRDCERRNNIVSFSSTPHDPSRPITLTRVDQGAGAPVEFELADGRTLPTGPGKGGLYGNSAALKYSAAASSADRNYYLSEAHLLTYWNKP